MLLLSEVHYFSHGILIAITVRYGAHIAFRSSCAGPCLGQVCFIDVFVRLLALTQIRDFSDVTAKRQSPGGLIRHAKVIYYIFFRPLHWS